jgi:PAS domain S-box-containing protein
MTAPQAPLLVVDDDPVNRDMLSRRLIRRGYTVATVASGREALAYVAAHPVALVLLDVQMPEMSGLEVLQALRQTQSSARLPVLMVTAKDQSEDIVTALELGADDYVTKPIDFPVTIARIRTQLSRKEAEDRLRESEERYTLAAAGANDGLWDWKLSTAEIYYSARWKAIIGYEDHEIGSSPEEWFERVHPEDRPRVKQDIEAHLAGLSSHFESEHRMRHKGGTFRWVLTRGMAVRDAEGVAVRMAGSQSDITEGKVVDALTGLPNRMLLIDRLERVLQHHQMHGESQFAVLFLDLDGFKVVNDSLGHLAGDDFLQAVARRLEASLRSTDVLTRASGEVPHNGTNEHTLARLGGDEFIILLHEVRGVLDATRVAARIQQSLSRPFRVAEREVFTTASIGIAVSGSGYTRSEDMLRDADTAMYRAKSLGKGRSEVFDVAMREQVLSRLQLETSVRLGLERHEFLPYYQPIIDLRTGRLTGFEALLRWRHPDRGIVAPLEFVPLIEENGLVLPIGRRFFQDVCGQLRRWRDGHPAASRLRVNVNFASQQFLEVGLPARLLESLDDAHLEPSSIVVEITERTAIGNFALTGDVLNELRLAGIEVVLDDFGTGYSSLACLNQLPISGLKLDPSFTGGQQRIEIIRAVVALAGSLNLTVTAEGVETIEQFVRFRELGCTYAQGYLFARPLDAEAAAEVIAQDRDWLDVTTASRAADQMVNCR